MKKINNKSEFKDFLCVVVRPVECGRVVTKMDQKRIGQLFTWKNAKFSMIHLDAEKRDEVVARLKRLKLSKKMVATVLPEVCWTNRFKLEETIKGTGVHATNRQLSESFEIG